MAAEIQESIEKLNDLAETIKDSEEGYRTAADGTKDQETKTLFERYAEQRHRMNEDLKACIRSLGVEPPESGSAAGHVHRIWTSIKSAVSRDDALAMLEECERGEDFTKKEFREALDIGLPLGLRPALETMYTQVLEAHDQVKALRDQHRRSH